MLGVDFYGQATWEDFHKLNWVPGIWKKLNPARNVVWSVPLTITGTPLADVADGLHDAEFEAARPRDCRCAAAGDHPSRLGNESVYHGMVRQGPGSRLHQRRSGASSRSSGATPAISDTTGVRDGDRRTSPADLAYPGDDVVDYIGLDVYDFKHEGSSEERWNNFYLKAPFGLEWHRDFAAAARQAR